MRKFAYEQDGIVIIPEDELREYDFPRWKNYLQEFEELQDNYTFEMFLDEWMAMFQAWEV